MEGKLEFELPKELVEFRAASEATILSLCAWRFQEKLHRMVKDGDTCTLEQVEHMWLDEMSEVYNIIND